MVVVIINESASPGKIASKRDSINNT